MASFLLQGSYPNKIWMQQNHGYTYEDCYLFAAKASNKKV